jgi:hypothetical protein
MKKLTFYPIKIDVHEDGKICYHFNIALLIYSEEEDIYYFEWYEPDYDIKMKDDLRYRTIEHMLQELCEVLGFKYVTSSNHCIQGIQRTELKNGYVSIPLLETQITEPIGYCVPYSYLYMECKIHNPRLPFLTSMIERNIYDIMLHFANIYNNELFITNPILQFIRYYTAAVSTKVSLTASPSPRNPTTSSLVSPIGGSQMVFTKTSESVEVYYKSRKLKRVVYVNKRGTKYIKLYGTYRALNKLKGE